MLTDAKIKKAKPGEKDAKLRDGGGLFLLVKSGGGRWWRLDYRIRGVRKTISLGVYPEVSLALARQRRDEARSLVANGVDPSEKRRAEKRSGGDSFAAIANEWYAAKVVPVRTPAHSRTVRGRLDLHLLPALGARPIREVTAQTDLGALLPIQNGGARETAHRCLQICSQVFRYAVQTGRADVDPTPALRGALLPPETKSHAAVTKPGELAGYLRAFNAYDGTLVVRSALRLAPLLFVRPGELRHMEWSEINWPRERWEIPGEKMKMGNPHIVPLASQSLAILRDLYPLTGSGRYVFPSLRSTNRPMSDNAVLSALRRMGIEKDVMSGHGFRATARTLLDEELHERVDLIEHQLAHAVKDPNGRAYNRTQFLPERAKMMQRWADYLDRLKNEKSDAVERSSEIS